MAAVLALGAGAGYGVPIIKSLAMVVRVRVGKLATDFPLGNERRGHLICRGSEVLGVCLCLRAWRFGELPVGCAVVRGGDCWPWRCECGTAASSEAQYLFFHTGESAVGSDYDVVQQFYVQQFASGPDVSGSGGVFGTRLWGAAGMVVSYDYVRRVGENRRTQNFGGP